MIVESVNGTPGGRRACPPTGFRRLSQDLLKVDRIAEGFTALPDGVTKHCQLLAAFKAAAPRLGLSLRLVHVIDWLFKFSRPQDWCRGARPIVWPSAASQQDALGLSRSRVKEINRALIDAGLITMKDSANGKRYGKRDPKDNIVEAYGFDLSPMAERHAEFTRLAKEAREEHETMRRLRRQATIARKGIAQILQTVAEYGFQGDDWETLQRETHSLAQALKNVQRPEEMAMGVAGLERRQKSAVKRLETLLTEQKLIAAESVDAGPQGPENRPHQYTYKSKSDPEQDTVIAQEQAGNVAGDAIEPRAVPVRPEPAEMVGALKIYPKELVDLAPKLKPWLHRPHPTWPDVVDAASFLAAELGVSDWLRAKACRIMGRERTAIAIAIVSTKDRSHFRTTAGGYFHGMVFKAETGTLNLDRTIWGMRQAKRDQG